jgi:hypothetical protein
MFEQVGMGAARVLQDICQDTHIEVSLKPPLPRSSWCGFAFPTALLNI